MNESLKTYQRAHCDGMSQRDLVVMCYQGTIKFLQEARSKLANNEIEAFGDLIERAHRVIFHLHTTLDHERGGEIALRLADLYGYIIAQLYLLNATKKVDILEGIIDILGTIKEGWESIDSGAATAGDRSKSHPVEPRRQIVSVEV